MWEQRFSKRVRLLGPIGVATSLLLHRQSVTAQDDEGRHRAEPTPSAPVSDPLSSLLNLIPVEALETGDASLSITFGDISTQLAAGGVKPPDSIDDAEGMHLWINASFPIALADPFRSKALVLNRELIGYDVTDIDQTLDAGAPPDIRTLIRGRFDQAAVAAAWERNGYKVLEVGGVTVASLFEDAQIEFENAISQLVLARMNNAAFMPDGTLAYAPSLDLLTEMIAVANGDGMSVTQNAGIETLLASVTTPLVSAIFFSGTDLSAASMLPPDLMTDEAAIAEINRQLETPEPMPAISLGLLGITAGGPTVIPDEGEDAVIDFPVSTIVFRLLMAKAGTAEVAATVVDARLGSMQSLLTNQPYSDIYGHWDAKAVADGDILALDLLPADGLPVSIWTRGFFSRDLLFLAW